MLWFAVIVLTCLAVLGAAWPLLFRRKTGGEAASEIAFFFKPEEIVG